VHEPQAVTAIAAGATVFVASRYGLLKMVPALGSVGAPLVTIALGAAIAVLPSVEGTTGDILEGVGYGLIAAGVLEIGR
jgi:hypothetical protein